MRCSARREFCRKAATAQKGVRINMVAPATTATAMMSSDPSVVAAQVPRGRVNQAHEVAAVIAFMLSPDSEAMGLREVVVDGGMLHGG